MNSRRRFRMKALFIGLLTAKIGVTLVYLTGTVSISELFLTQPAAIAQEKPLESQQNKAKASETTSITKPTEPPRVDLTAVLKRLDRERNQIDRERENIQKQRVQLDVLKQEIEEKIEKLSKIQQQIAADIAKQEAMDDKRNKTEQAQEDAKIKMLGKVYSSMKPKQAAAIINKMDIEVIQKVFSQMKGEQIGSILSYVDQERAALISEKLAEKKIIQTN